MRWKLIAVALGAALAASLLFPPGVSGQEGGQNSEQEKRDALRKKQADLDAHRLDGNIETLRQMQGGWLLSEFRSVDLPDAGRDDVAFMVVSSEFLAIEIHMAYFDGAGDVEESYIQTGIYRLNFNIYGDLTATLLIGSGDTPWGLTMPQPPGRISVFKVKVERETLTLSSEDGTRFTFHRMATGQMTLRVFEETDWLPKAKQPESAVEAGPGED